MRPSSGASRSSLRRLIAGVIALPLSVIPFVAYASMTPEGRLVRDRVLVAVRPPTLPTLSPATKAEVAANAPRYKDGVMVLAYHGINSSDAEGGFIVSPGRFGEHLVALRAAGMNTVTAAQVAEAFDAGKKLPENAVMISFDDGRSDAMLFADRLLAQAGMSATMFVISGRASDPGVYYASWSALESYARSGRWDLQSHTASSHFEQPVRGGGTLPALTSLHPRESLTEYRARVRDDLSRASSSIQEHSGRRPVAFAYPFGAYGAERTNDPGIRSILREEVDRQYTVAFHQDDQESVPLATADQDRLGLRRLEVENWSGAELLRQIAASAERTAVQPATDQTSKSPLPVQSVEPPVVTPPPIVTPSPSVTPLPVPVPRITPGPIRTPVEQLLCVTEPFVDLLGLEKPLATCAPAGR